MSWQLQVLRCKKKLLQGLKTPSLQPKTASLRWVQIPPFLNDCKRKGLGFASSGFVRGPATVGMATANSGVSFGRERRCGGGEESWGSGMSAEGSNREGASRRMKKKFVPPVCNCGSYAILFESGTSKNPRKLFFGCSYFKNNTGHCKYFAWLDEYAASFYIDEVLQNGVADPTKKMVERIAEIEKKMDEVKNDEKNKGALSRWKVFGLILLGIVIGKGCSLVTAV